ncbi:HlyD family type I secretion periplasmic adaptor subunit [Rhodovibrionaceae bacterium A322]
MKSLPPPVSTLSLRLDDIRKGPKLSRYITATLVIGGIWFGGFGGWSTVATLDSAAPASGVLTVKSHRKTIQHKDGGIIETIHVKDGDKVDEDQVLITFDDTQPRAALSIIEGQYYLALAQRDRYLAEFDDKDELIFSAEVTDQSYEPSVQQIMAGQLQQFKARRDSLKSQLDVMEGRLAEFDERIAALQSQSQAVNEQLGYIREELQAVEVLFKKGLEKKPRVLALKRSIAQLKGNYAQLQGQIAEARQGISATKLQMIDVKNVNRAEVTNGLEITEKELADLSERLIASRDIVERTVVFAPISGTIVGSRFFTEQGVVASGEAILDIVPQDDELIASVKVRPTDIDSVYIGQAATVNLLAFSEGRREIPSIDATVTNLSADLVTDDSGAEEYYSATLTLDGSDMEDSIIDELYPGMPVQAMISLGERTVIDYLISPLTRSLDTTFREQ